MSASLSVGDWVAASAAPGKLGRVLTIEGEKARVQWGPKRTWIPVEKLIKRGWRS